MYIHILLLALSWMLCSTAQAQERAGAPEEIEEIEEITEIEPSTVWNSNNFPIMDRTINVATPRTMRKLSLLFLMEHRTRQSLRDKPFHDLLGFDSGGLKIGIGLRYGVLDRLEAGFYRLNGTVEIFDTYEFDVKYHFLSDNRFPLDAAIRLGISWFSQDEIDDDAGLFGQLLFGKTIRGRASIGTGLLLHTNSSSDRKSLVDEESSLAIPAQLEVLLTPKWSWNIEVVTNVAGYGEEHPVVSSSLKIMTHRHTFSIVVSNTQYMGADGIVANTSKSLKDAIIGFTITRELGF